MSKCEIGDGHSPGSVGVADEEEELRFFKLGSAADKGS